MRQQQEQIAELQTLLVVRRGVEEKDGVEVIALRSNTRLNIDMAKPPTFNRDTTKVSDFITACKLYIRIKMRDTLVKEQI